MLAFFFIPDEKPMPARGLNPVGGIEYEEFRQSPRYTPDPEPGRREY
jgi:hypothetical protein